MSLLIAELEAHPPTPELVPESPILKYLSCLEENAPHFPHSLRNRLLDPKKWPGLAKDLAKDRMMNSFLATSQAFDLIRGGVKVNALPEVVRATADYRISLYVPTSYDRLYQLVIGPRDLGLCRVHSDAQGQVSRLDHVDRIPIKAQGLEEVASTPHSGRDCEWRTGARSDHPIRREEFRLYGRNHQDGLRE